MLDGKGGKGLKASRIAAACEASLKRLQTDVIDVYFAHKDDPETPLEETMGAFDALVKADKVRAIGASNYTAPRLAEALRISAQAGLARYESLQPPSNLYDRATFETDLAALCEREQVGVIP